MGQPDFKELELRINWKGGKPASVTRVDGQGCGGEGNPRNLDTPIRALVTEHINHCVNHHGLTPPQPLCDYSVEDEHTNLYFECTLAPHKGNDHILALRKED